MSRAGEHLQQHLEKLRNYLAAQATGAKGSNKSVEFLHGLLDAFDDMNTRIQDIEREIGRSDAFVDPNEGSHRIR